MQPRSGAVLQPTSSSKAAPRTIFLRAVALTPKAMVSPDHSDGGCHFNAVVDQSGQPMRGLLKKAFVAGAAKKLLGKPGGRQRPHAYDETATEDDGSNPDHAFWAF